MQITVTIPDEIAAQVQVCGLTPESYGKKLIAEQITSLQKSIPSHEVSLDEFNTSLDALTQYSDKIPLLPIQSFSRASFYEDHD